MIRQAARYIARVGICTVILGTSLYACGPNTDNVNLKLAATVPNPDIYVTGMDKNGRYVLAESEKEGCILAYAGKSSKQGSKPITLFSGKDCKSISQYAKVVSSWDLESIVRKGSLDGHILEKANLKSVMLPDDEVKSLLNDYNKSVEYIQEKHFKK